MRAIAIWCGSAADVTRHANALGIARRLVSVAPDPEIKYAFWAFFCLDAPEFERVTAIPRLTWK